MNGECNYPQKMHERNGMASSHQHAHELHFRFISWVRVVLVLGLQSNSIAIYLNIIIIITRIRGNWQKCLNFR